MKEEWIQQMRQKMADYSQPAPEVSWSVIDGAVPAHSVFPLWLKSVAAAAVVILVAGIGLKFLDHGDATFDQPVNNVIENESQPVHEQVEHIEYVEQQTNQSEQIKPARQIRQSAGQPAHTVLAMAVPDKTEDTAIPSAEKTIDRQTDHTTGHETDQAQSQDQPVVRNPEPALPTELYNKKRSKESRLMAMAYVSNSINDSQHFESYGTGIINPPNNQSGPYTTDKNNGTDRKVHHRQPLRFGLSLRYRIDDRWSLEAGLAYTRLISDITSTRDGVSNREIQSLNYIGIPLKVGYDIWSNRKFDIYATTGGAIDRMLDYSFWQFSVNGSLGADYKLTNGLSIYAEEGIGYYFNDGSSLSTIYKDHPLTFNLSLGLRFHF